MFSNCTCHYADNQRSGFVSSICTLLLHKPHYYIFNLIIKSSYNLTLYAPFCFFGRWQCLNFDDEHIRAVFPGSCHDEVWFRPFLLQRQNACKERDTLKNHFGLWFCAIILTELSVIFADEESFLFGSLDGFVAAAWSNIWKIVLLSICIQVIILLALNIISHLCFLYNKKILSLNESYQDIERSISPKNLNSVIIYLSLKLLKFLSVPQTKLSHGFRWFRI